MDNDCCRVLFSYLLNCIFDDRESYKAIDQTNLLINLKK